MAEADRRRHTTGTYRRHPIETRPQFLDKLEQFRKARRRAELIDIEWQKQVRHNAFLRRVLEKEALGPKHRRWVIE